MVDFHKFHYILTIYGEVLDGRWMRNGRLACCAPPSTLAVMQMLLVVAMAMVVAPDFGPSTHENPERRRPLDSVSMELRPIVALAAIFAVIYCDAWRGIIASMQALQMGCCWKRNASECVIMRLSVECDGFWFCHSRRCAVHNIQRSKQFKFECLNV